jgi:hypothetical protein
MAEHTRDSRAPGTVVTIPPVNVGVSVLAVAFTVLVTLLFWASTDTHEHETLTFLIAAGALAGALASAHYAWAALKATLQQRDEVLNEQKAAAEKQKVAAALLFVQRWNDPNLATLRKDWRELADTLEKDPSRVPELLKVDIAKRTVVADVLNFFEEMGYAVRSGAADPKTLGVIFDFVALKYYRVARPWIEFRRRESAKAWSEFEWLCDQWKNN